MDEDPIPFSNTEYDLTKEELEFESFTRISEGRLVLKQLLDDAFIETELSHADEYALSRRIGNYYADPDFGERFVDICGTEFDIEAIPQDVIDTIRIGIEEEDRMVEQYIGFPIYVARIVDPDDYSDLLDVLISAGNVALMFAVRNYDPEDERGSSFMNYAYRELWGTMKRAQEGENIIHIPSTSQELEIKYSRLVLIEYGGEKPDLDSWQSRADLALKMADYGIMNIDENDIAMLEDPVLSQNDEDLQARISRRQEKLLYTIDISRNVKRIIPLHIRLPRSMRPVNIDELEDDTDILVEDALQDPRDMYAEIDDLDELRDPFNDNAPYNEQRAYINKLVAFGILPQSEKRVLYLRYYLGLSSKEIAEMSNFSVTRANQLLSRARSRLKLAAKKFN